MAAELALAELVSQVASRLIKSGQKLAVAESCTGGLIAKLLTDLAGSSAWFDCGVVSYSNTAKQALLGVSDISLQRFGAVSAPVVLEMAQGLLQRAPVDWTIAVSGVAGPGGGTADKPVGTVWLAFAGRGVAASASRLQFDGDRDQVRVATAFAALQGLLSLLPMLRTADALGLPA